MAVNMVTYLEDVDQESVTIDDILAKPPLLNILPVEGRIICFYGFRPIIESMKLARREAIKNGKTFSRISVVATNNAEPRGTAAGLADEDVISIWRADKPLRDKITGVLRDKLGARYKGMNVLSAEIDDLFEAEPELFNLLWEHPDFAHINVFLWRGKYNCATQLGLIRERSLIESIDVTT